MAVSVYTMVYTVLHTAVYTVLHTAVYTVLHTAVYTVLHTAVYTAWASAAFVPALPVSCLWALLYIHYKCSCAAAEQWM